MMAIERAGPPGGGKGMIQGLLLAAGEGRRFKGDKRLYPLTDGTPMALAAARNLTAVLESVCGVVRPGDKALTVLLEAQGIRVVVNPKPGRGMGRSLAQGVLATPQADGWLVALADMPYIRPATIAALADRLKAGAELVAPFYRGQRGHPVGFAGSFYGNLSELDGDRGARDILKTRFHRLERWECDDPGVLLDFDTVAELKGSPQPPTGD